MSITDFAKKLLGNKLLSQAQTTVSELSVAVLKNRALSTDVRIASSKDDVPNGTVIITFDNEIRDTLGSERDYPGEEIDIGLTYPAQKVMAALRSHGIVVDASPAKRYAEHFSIDYSRGKVMDEDGTTIYPPARPSIHYQEYHIHPEQNGGVDELTRKLEAVEAQFKSPKQDQHSCSFCDGVEQSRAAGQGRNR